MGKSCKVFKTRGADTCNFEKPNKSKGTILFCSYHLIMLIKYIYNINLFYNNVIKMDIV